MMSIVSTEYRVEACELFRGEGERWGTGQTVITAWQHNNHFVPAHLCSPSHLTCQTLHTQHSTQHPSWGPDGIITPSLSIQVTHQHRGSYPQYTALTIRTIQTYNHCHSLQNSMFKSLVQCSLRCQYFIGWYNISPNPNSIQPRLEFYIIRSGNKENLLHTYNGPGGGREEPFSGLNEHE